MGEKTDNHLTMYSSHTCEKTPDILDCVEFKRTHPDINYPCLILIRVNNWNDYNYYTHFATFFLKNKNGGITDLGTVKILQSKAKEGYTTLPNNFKSLSRTEFFSKGNLSFYAGLNSLGKLKDSILSALNDIYYFSYTKEHISKIDDGNLKIPYEKSLFRDDYYELAVSSEYAKNSLDMLDKIKACVRDLPKLGETNQKIVGKLLYGSVIAALESYLGDAFKYHVITNKIHSFLKNYKYPHSEDKYTLKELGLRETKICDFVENNVKEIMNGIIFHKLPAVIKLYKDILNVDLPSALIGFRDAVQKRHDIFHRNGYNMAGIELEINSYDITTLIDEVKKFISETEVSIEAQI